MKQLLNGKKLVILSILLIITTLTPIVVAKPHFLIPIYRITGDVREATNPVKVVGKWRYHVKLNSSGGWHDGDKFTWEARDWLFDLDCTIDSSENDKTHFRLRNFRYTSAGGWAYWTGNGYGKQDAGPYEFVATGYIDLYVNGDLLGDNVFIDASLVRTSLNEPGLFSIYIDHPMILALSGGELTGIVTRFQVIDFQSLK